MQDKTNLSPFSYKYHHTVSELSIDTANANSVYDIGDLTQLFTVLTLLIEEGDTAWSRSIVDYVPELSDYSSDTPIKDAVRQVD